jgi:hypothetical protein
MTDEELARIEALANAATPGPWEVRAHDDLFAVKGQSGWVASMDADTSAADASNSEFIAAARDAVPALVAEVKRFRALLVRAAEELPTNDFGAYDRRALAEEIEEALRK